METLEELSGYKAQDFSLWLIRRLRLAREGNSEERHKAFDFRSMGIFDGESHFDDLTRFFKEKLPPSAQQAFRESIHYLISTSKVEDFSSQIMSDLILIAWLVKSNKALDILIPAVIESEWGKQYRSLIYDVVSILSAVKGQEKNVKILKKNFGFR